MDLWTALLSTSYKIFPLVLKNFFLFYQTFLKSSTTELKLQISPPRFTADLVATNPPLKFSLRQIPEQIRNANRQRISIRNIANKGNPSRQRSPPNPASKIEARIGLASTGTRTQFDDFKSIKTSDRVSYHSR